MRRFVFAPRWVAGHVVVLVAVVSCILLGRWQWAVSQHTHSLQNLAYALQWPLFAVFFLVAWWRMLHLESERLDEEELDDSAEPDTTEPDTTEPDTTAAPGDATAGADTSAGAEAPAGNEVSPEAKPERKRRRVTRPPVSEPLLYPPDRSAVTARYAVSAESHAAPGHPDRADSETDDEQLAAYNRMLAQLFAQDEQR